MNSTIEAAPDEEEMPVNGYTTWPTSQATPAANTNSILFIAVEYVKDAAHDFKFEAETPFSPPPSTYSDFDQHVSPLDPNMGSTARYSPVYTDTVDVSTVYNNPVVVLQNHNSLINPAVSNAQYVHPNVQNSGFVNTLTTTEAALEEISTTLTTADNNLLNQVVSNRYLQMVAEESSPAAASPPPSPNGLHLVPLEQYERSIKTDPGQGVELLITDQTTGISYSVPQEYLVSRSLSDEQQLLDALAPGPLLDSDLLALEESTLTLKSHLNDIDPLNVDIIKEEVANNNSMQLSSSLSPVNGSIKEPPNDDNFVESIGATLEIEFENQRRSRRQLLVVKEEEKEEILLSEVQSICDKPVPTRARATLPESYLVINKHNDKEGVFARKLITKKTQFGPLEGVVLEGRVTIPIPEPHKGFHLIIESESGMHYLDVSDENSSNWMRFVRPAKNCNEQNIVLSQQGHSLYYTTTKPILPRQELLVGYSTSYAEKRQLAALEPEKIDFMWPCFECPQSFATSNELQNHLNVHDAGKNENTKPRCKKSPKCKRRILSSKKFHRTELFECTICHVTFPRFNLLKKHFFEHSMADKKKKSSEITERIYCCDSCSFSFPTVDVLKIHAASHGSLDRFTSKDNKCPVCEEHFTEYKELIYHVEEHAISKSISKTSLIDFYKCNFCYKVFALKERLQRHMMVHGSEDLKPLKCDTCNKRFLNNSALACHVKIHKPDKKIFECPICKTFFDHVLHLKEHVRIHCIDGKYTCPHCAKEFREYSIIRKHIRAFHCDRKHLCPHCNKPFPTLDKLRMHLLRHSDHREFLCADCGKQFKRKDKLKEHIKRMHTGERDPLPIKTRTSPAQTKRFTPKVQPTDYHRFIYKCHTCMVGFKRRGMLVNHLAKRHPDISPDSVPELNLPILRTTRDYYCQYCEKVYKSSSKRKAHILKNHPGAELPMSNRRRGGLPEPNPGEPNPTFSQTVGSVTTHPHGCQWCHKQYASKAKLLQHQRKKHADLICGQTPQSKDRPQNQPSQVVDSPNSLSPNADMVNAHCPAPDESASVAGLDTNASAGYTIVSIGKCDEITIEETDYKRDFKVTEDLLSEVEPAALEDELNAAAGRTAQYYQLIQMSSGQFALSETSDYATPATAVESNRLYRLLNPGGDVPPR